MERRNLNILDITRRALIGAGYFGLASIIVGAFVTFINRVHPLGNFDIASEASGITLLVAGAVVLVASAFTVWKWFREK